MSKNRIEWVDYAKGISIILVVLFHASSRNLDSIFFHPVIDDINEYFRLFRMPLFFFLSGIFISKSLRVSLKDFIKSKVMYLLYLYILWAFIKYILLDLSRYLISSDAEYLTRILTIFTSPPATLWFIYALAIFFVISRIVRNFPWIAFVLSLIPYALSIQSGEHFDLTFLDNLARYYPMFLLGHLSLEVLRKISSKVKVYHLALVVLSFYLSGQVLGSSLDSNFVVILFMNIFSILSGIIVSVLLTRTNHFEWLSYVGKNTLPIYVMHFIPITIFERIIAATYPDIPLLSISILLIAGVYLPLLMKNIAVRFGFSWLFTPPYMIKK